MLALLEGRDLMGERKHFARPSNAAGLSMKLSEESLEEFDAPSLKHPDNSKSDSLPFKKKGYQTAQLQLGPACSVRICSTAGLDGDHHRYHLYVRLPWFKRCIVSQWRWAAHRVGSLFTAAEPGDSAW